METIGGLGEDEDEEARVATVAYKDIAVPPPTRKPNTLEAPPAVPPRSLPRAARAPPGSPPPIP